MPINFGILGQQPGQQNQSPQQNPSTQGSGINWGLMLNNLQSQASGGQGMSSNTSGNQSNPQGNGTPQNMGVQRLGGVVAQGSMPQLPQSSDGGGGLGGLGGLLGGIAKAAGGAASLGGGQAGMVLQGGQTAGQAGATQNNIINAGNTAQSAGFGTGNSINSGNRTQIGVGQGNIFNTGNASQSMGTNQNNSLQKPTLTQGQGNNIGDQLYNSAYSMLGKKQGDPTLISYLQKTNPNLDPTQTPWCAGYVGSVLGANGIQGTGSLAAKSYLKFGTPTNTPTKGDIVVFNDLTGNNDPAHGHVGFVNSINTQNGTVSVLGGNQGHSVSIKDYPISAVAGYRIPPSGKQVQQFAQQQGMTHPAQLAGLPHQINQQAVNQDTSQTTSQATSQPFNQQVTQPFNVADEQANIAGQKVTATPQRPVNAFNPTYLPQDAHPELASTMAGIAHVESPGEVNPYNLEGPHTGRGDYAVGKYQIMASNVPSWSREALGYPVTPQQFKNNPELQERVASYQINKNLKQYGNANDAYSVWFSGRPASKAGNVHDSFGTTVPQYIKKANQGSLMYKEQNKQQPSPSIQSRMPILTPSDMGNQQSNPNDSDDLSDYFSSLYT